MCSEEEETKHVVTKALLGSEVGQFRRLPGDDVCFLDNNFQDIPVSLSRGTRRGSLQTLGAAWESRVNPRLVLKAG